MGRPDRPPSKPRPRSRSKTTGTAAKVLPSHSTLGLPPAITWALVRTRSSATTTPVPWRIWSHAGPAISTTDGRAARAARVARPRAGCGTGSAGSGGNPEKTSGNPMRSSTFPSCAASDGGGGSAASTTRTTAERWRERATDANGPAARLRPRNQTARTRAPAESADPPTASASLNRVPRARLRSFSPKTEPTASPIAPRRSTVPSATPALAGSDRTRLAVWGASHAPTVNPTASPTSPATWSMAPRR